ncbi:phosphatase PAP2 family protein [Candidatus Gottesmanbacteria bacterium]|nr:phosphatase PAP2 family protein [Candidatus Gottesmanbacteria bacterium]
MDILTLDNNLLIFISQNNNNSFLSFLALLFSGYGLLGLIWVLLAVILIIKERKHFRVIVLFFLTIISSSIINNGFLKLIFARLRPEYSIPNLQVYKITNDYYSFPSSHAAVAFAGAVILAAVFPKRKKLIYFIALLIAISRVYLAVHFPLDIIAGSLVGYVIGRTFLYINKKINFIKI